LCVLVLRDASLSLATRPLGAIGFGGKGQRPHVSSRAAVFGNPLFLSSYLLVCSPTSAHGTHRVEFWCRWHSYAAVAFGVSPQHPFGVGLGSQSHLRDVRVWRHTPRCVKTIENTVEFLCARKFAHVVLSATAAAPEAASGPSVTLAWWSCPVPRPGVAPASVALR